MGGGASTALYQRRLGKSELVIIDLMMPLYFDPVDCSLLEHQVAEQSWNLVLTDSSPEFLVKKGTEGFPYTSSVTLFYDTFYVRLFDIYPTAKQLFKSDIKDQGKFLVMMMSLALSEYSKPSQFDKSLVKLAEIHFKKGVKATECKSAISTLRCKFSDFLPDGIVGDVLFWTLRRVLGSDYFTPALLRIWIKIYSRMLKSIMPVAVVCELNAEKEGANGVVRQDVAAKMFPFHAASKLPYDQDDLIPLESQKILTSYRESEVFTRSSSSVGPIVDKAASA